MSSNRSSETDSSVPSDGYASDARRPFWQTNEQTAASHEEVEEEAPGGWAGEPSSEQEHTVASGPQQSPYAASAVTVSSLPAVALPNVVPVSAVLLTFVPVEQSAPAATDTRALQPDSVSLAPSVLDENHNQNSNWGAASDQLSLNEYLDGISLTSASNMFEPLRSEQQLQLSSAPATQTPPPAASQPLTLEQLFHQHPNLARGGFETTSTRSQQFRAAPHLSVHSSSYSVQSSPATASRFARFPQQAELQQMRFSSLQSFGPAGASVGGTATPTLGSLRSSLQHLNVDAAQLATGVSLMRVPLSSTHSSTSSSLNLAGAGPESVPVAGSSPAAHINNHEALAAPAYSPPHQLRWTPAQNITVEGPEPNLNNLNEGVAYVPIFPYYMQTEQFKYGSIFNPGASYVSHWLESLTMCSKLRIFRKYTLTLHIRVHTSS